MELQWTGEALSDLSRLYDFLRPVNEPAAARALLSLVKAPATLLDFPRIGERLEGYEAREVRRLLIGRYEIRYEIRQDAVVILRLWHTRENR